MAKNKLKDGGPEGLKNPKTNVDGSEEDVEGHRKKMLNATPDETGLPEGAKSKKTLFDGSEEDVEGHRKKMLNATPDEGGPEGARRMPRFDGDDDSVEGHKLLPK